MKIRRIQLKPNISVKNIELKVWNSNQDNSGKGEWKDNPSGIPEAIKALFPEPIEIGAMEDATEDVSKSKTSNTIGKLIAEIINPIEENYGAEIKESLDGLKKRLEANGNVRPKELIEFDTKANKNIIDLFPGITIRLHVQHPK